jgi:hypothetical protein
MHSYIFWALLGMAGYSFGTFFVKLAERGGALVPARSSPSAPSLPCARRDQAALRHGAGHSQVDRRRHRAHRRGELAVPCAVAWVGQRGGADLGHVHCRRQPCSASVPRRADDLEQDCRPHRRRTRRGADLDLAGYDAARRATLAGLPLFAPRIIASGEAILLNAAILIANEPVSGAKRQDRRGEREELQGLG